MPGVNQSASAGSRPTSARTLRNRQDASRFLDRFAALTGLAATSASAECLPREFLARPVPAPDVLTTRYGPRLSRRTYNALCRFEPAPPGEPWTFGRLLQIRGFGLFCLLDLLELQARQGATLGKAAGRGEPND
jgi:hypothetical protein